MKKILILVSLLSIQNLGKAQNMPKVGDYFEISNTNLGKIYSPPPLDFLDKAVCNFNGINFNLGIKNNKICYISTSDPRFKLNKKQYIGKKLNEIKTYGELINIPGWGNYIEIDGGWNATFTYKEFNSNSVVLFLFKNK